MFVSAGHKETSTFSMYIQQDSSMRATPKKHTSHRPVDLAGATPLQWYLKVSSTNHGTTESPVTGFLISQKPPFSKAYVFSKGGKKINMDHLDVGTDGPFNKTQLVNPTLTPLMICSTRGGRCPDPAKPRFGSCPREGQQETWFLSNKFVLKSWKNQNHIEKKHTHVQWKF